MIRRLSFGCGCREFLQAKLAIVSEVFHLADCWILIWTEPMDDFVVSYVLSVLERYYWTSYNVCPDIFCRERPWMVLHVMVCSSAIDLTAKWSVQVTHCKMGGHPSKATQDRLAAARKKWGELSFYPCSIITPFFYPLHVSCTHYHGMYMLWNIDLCAFLN